ncbi:MAG: PAS domain S-box protein, partial [Treponema sp.]|nr:PAS domain S-box protein [Treponema sp.]
MEGKKNNFIRKYIFSEELSLDARLVNITCLTGGLGIFLAMMFRIVISISEFYGIIVVLAVALAVIILIMFIANFFHAYTTTKIITIVLMCLIMLPTAFFFVGGIGTSIECYFVLALFIILQLTRGWLCAFFATLHVILVSLCHYIQYIHPELIEKLSGSADSLKKIKYIDTIQGYLISSLIIGIIVSVQSYFYRMEKAKNESVTHDLRIAQQTTSAMFEGNPHINILFDDKFNIVDCNPIALNYLGFADKDELRQKFVQQMIQAIPAFQSNGKRSISLVERLNTAVKEGAVHFETELFLLGQKRILDVNLIRIPYGDNFAIVGYLVDLTAARATERELIQQDKLLAAVNGAATMLFSDVDFETALTKSIEQLAAGANLDSISVWNIFEVNGKKECNKIIEWFTDAKTEKMSLDPRDDQFNQIIMQWEAKVRQGENFNGPLYTFSEDVQEKLKPMGVTSLLVIPIYIQKNFWGFMSFNDHHEERTFSDNEVNILRSGSLLVSGAVIRNQMTQKISDTANRLNTVLSNYAGIIWSVDKEGIITTFNGQYLEKIGVAPNFLVGKNIDLARAKNIHGDILENVKIALQDEKEQNWIGEVNGRQFQHHLSPLYSAEGNFIGVMGSTDDITESVILQNELKAAMEEAQAASRAKGEFLSNMSHEIRTPMNAIIGMTSIGKGSGDIERKNYAFGKIEDASSHLLGIINDILDMSKIEAGKFELSFVEFSFEKMLRRVSDVITFKMDEKKQKFMVRIDKNIPSLLMGDDMRLAQVITNLLSNAVKFTPEGGVINMNAVYMGEEDNNVTLRVEVRDSGIGISPDQQAR